VQSDLNIDCLHNQATNGCNSQGSNIQPSTWGKEMALQQLLECHGFEATLKNCPLTTAQYQVSPICRICLFPLFDHPFNVLPSKVSLKPSKKEAVDIQQAQRCTPSWVYSSYRASKTSRVWQAPGQGSYICVQQRTVQCWIKKMNCGSMNLHHNISSMYWEQDQLSIPWLCCTMAPWQQLLDDSSYDNCHGDCYGNHYWYPNQHATGIIFYFLQLT